MLHTAEHVLRHFFICAWKLEKSEGNSSTCFNDSPLKRTIWKCGAHLAPFRFWAISHLLWDVFSTMRERRAAWNRDSWKVNINFRGQNLSVCCRLSRSVRRANSSVELLFLSGWLYFWCLWERIQRQRRGWSNCVFSSWSASRFVPGVFPWPWSPLIFCLMLFVTGRRGSADKIVSHVPRCVKFTTSHLCSHPQWI